ncbi:MAG: glycoside hydrolase family 2 protein [Methylobacteriaceae bacterium]|nr:glycoside hydrolase family 2 protein [Methylobacteriaceae bacterium]
MARIHSFTGQTFTALRRWSAVVMQQGRVLLDADFNEARVAGTIADALIQACRWSWNDPVPLDEGEVWYRCDFEANGSHCIEFHGLATIADIFLDGEHIGSSRSMFVPLTCDVNLSGKHRLEIRFRALTPFLENKSRARWRPRMIQPSGLRNVRTTALGRMPGFAPPAPPVGPWRDIELVSHSPVRALHADLKPRLENSTGVLDVRIEMHGAQDSEAILTCAGETTTLRQTRAEVYEGTLRVADAAKWWPHTHGEPSLHKVTAQVGETKIDLGRVGFRNIEIDRGADGRGFGLIVNDVPIFCRGVVWTPADPIGLDSSREALLPLLQRARDAGMNMLRVGGTFVYESNSFFELCDELGILLWHDFQFANFDYPIGDPDFRKLIQEEARAFLDRTQASPALAILCGGSEVYQQAAMMGVPEKSWRSPLFDEVLPAITREMRPDCTYVENSPSGGALPFHSDCGVAHYYGVGAYRRPLEDARRANVRFASECLGFANVPDAASVARDFGDEPLANPLWNACIPRDWGASQDFEQVRDHYVGDLYGVDVQELRGRDPQHYLNLGRATVAEAMEATFAEWRRAGSPTRGGLVWFSKDLWASSGWGVLDWRGEPKSAWYALRRAFRRVQLVVADEGVNGMMLHLINETAEAIEAIVTLECLNDGKTSVMRAQRAVTLPARSTIALSDVDLWGAFFDTPYAYRFGPPSHDVTVATLATPAGVVIAEAFHLPIGRAALPPSEPIAVTLEEDGQTPQLRLRASSFAQSVRIEDFGFRPADDWFHLPPERDKVVALTRRPDGTATRPHGIVAPLFGKPVPYGEPS